MAEKEYIERGTMLTTIQRYEDWECPATPSALKLVDMIRGRLREIPAADVVEVVHGEWKLHGNDDDLGSTYWCSHCYFQVDEELFYPHGYDEEKPYNYCPRCGAKMDGATDNNVGGKRKE